MFTFQINDTVGEIVAQHPALSRVFEKAGIDYCCGGKKTLDEACGPQGLNPHTLLDELKESVSSPEKPTLDIIAMSLTELADHIEQTHHVYLRSELPRLDALTAKVASVHGEKDSRLFEIRETFVTLFEELSSHMMKEEQILFPMVRQIEKSAASPDFHCGSLANPIRQMEMEHDNAGSALESLKKLSGGYTAPEWACNTYRAMLDALARFELDLHQHIHKENNVLFPRALKMESEKGN